MGMETIARMIMANNANLPGVNDFTQGAQGIQQMLNGQLEYAQARDNYEAMRGLRALFAQNPNPDLGQIGALSPEFAQKYMINNLTMGEKALGMRKTAKEISNIDSQQLERDAKLWAPMVGALAEQYLDQPDSPEFRAKLGQLIADGQKQGLSIAPGFNIETMTADKLLNIAISRGYESPSVKQRYEVDTEAQKRAMAPPVPPEIAYPTKQWDPQSGQFVRNDPTMPMSPGGRARTAGGGYRVMKPQQETHVDVSGISNLDDLYQLYKQYPQGSAARIEIGNRINELQDPGASYEEEPDERPSAGITPEQNRQIREDLKEKERQAEIAAAATKKENELKATRDAEKQRAIEAFSLVPPLSEVESILKQSTSGPLESKAAQLYSMTGKATPGMEMIGDLEAIQGQLQDAVTRAPGDPSTKETLMQYAKTGNLNDPNIPWNQRLRSYTRFVEMMRKMIEQQTGIQTMPGSGGGSASGYTARQQALISQSKTEGWSKERFTQEWNALPDEE